MLTLRTLTICFCAFFINLFAFAQCDGQRYYNKVFNNVDVDYEVDYHVNSSYGLDIYQPVGDTETERPVILLAFGGAFVTGTSTSPDIVTLCNEFAERGYVAVSMDYRLSPDLIWDNSTQNAYQAVMYAYHDMKAAIRWLYKDAATNNTYKLDTNKIFIGGVSAGAIAAVHVAYLDDINEAPPLLLSEINANGGIEGNSGNPGYSTEIAGVINLCGAVLDTSWIQPGDEPIVSCHGDNDGTVPHDTSPITLLGLNLTVSGSQSIHIRANNIGLINEYLEWPGAGHTPFVSSSSYMNETVEEVRDFLFPLVCTSGIDLDLKVLLEGAHNNFGQMRTDINSFIPLQSPYSVSPFNAPAESASSIPADAVDWILVELRTGTASTSPPRATINIEQKSGFLLSDGSVVGPDGVNQLRFSIPETGQYHIAVRHRNHLDVLSNVAVSPVNGVLTFDFTNNLNAAFGGGQLKLFNGYTLMYAADINQDVTIQITDYDQWKLTPAILNVYDEADTNMDGSIQVTDYDLWYQNRTKLGHHEMDY